jgi:hypothetical protein
VIDPYVLEATPAGLTATLVSVGGDHACAITTAGATRCWGNSHRGQAPQPALPEAAPPEGRVGKAYRFAVGDLAGSPRPGTATYALAGGPAGGPAAGALPPGLALTPVGAIEGTPTKAGTYAVTVQAADAVGFQASRTYTVEIAP